MGTCSNSGSPPARADAVGRRRGRTDRNGASEVDQAGLRRAYGAFAALAARPSPTRSDDRPAPAHHGGSARMPWTAPWHHRRLASKPSRSRSATPTGRVAALLKMSIRP